MDYISGVEEFVARYPELFDGTNIPAPNLTVCKLNLSFKMTYIFK